MQAIAALAGAPGQRSDRDEEADWRCLEPALRTQAGSAQRLLMMMVVVSSSIVAGSRAGVAVASLGGADRGRQPRRGRDRRGKCWTNRLAAAAAAASDSTSAVLSGPSRERKNSEMPPHPLRRLPSRFVAGAPFSASWPVSAATGHLCLCLSCCQPAWLHPRLRLRLLCRPELTRPVPELRSDSLPSPCLRPPLFPSSSSAPYPYPCPSCPSCRHPWHFSRPPSTTTVRLRLERPPSRRWRVELSSLRARRPASCPCPCPWPRWSWRWRWRWHRHRRWLSRRRGLACARLSRRLSADGGDRAGE